MNWTARLVDAVNEYLTKKTKATVMRRTTEATGLTIMRKLLFSLLFVLVCGLFVGQPVYAKMGQNGACINCHSEKNSTATISLSIDGTPLTLTPVGGLDWNDEASFSIPTGTAFEIDFIADGIVRNDSSNNAILFDTAGANDWVVNGGTVPYIDGVTDNGGTGLATTLPNWNTVWDGNHASMPIWNEAARATNGSVANIIGNLYTKNMVGTAWDEGNADTVKNDASAADLDGVASRMGFDAVLTSPTVAGSYVFYVIGIGSGDTSSKGYAATKVTVTVTGGGDVTPPTEVGNLAMTTDSGTHVAGAFTMTADFNDAETAVTACDYTINGGGAWSAGVVSGAGPYTCTAAIASQTDGSAIDARMRATSGGGTSTVVQSVTRTVDNIAPTTSDDAPAGWQSTDATITLTESDARSGVASSQYCVDSADTCDPSAGTTYSVPVSVTEAGESTQYFRYISTDNVGNVQTLVTKPIQIDKVAPTDGTLGTTPGSNQIDLSWSAATDGGSGLRTTNAYKLFRGTSAPAASSCDEPTTGEIYAGNATTYLDTGVTNGTPYFYLLCAYDNLNQRSTGATATDTPSLSCSYATPSVSINPAFSGQIITDGGSKAYNVDITNNDSGCPDTTFNLTINNTNANFTVTETGGDNQVTVAAGATVSTTLTVTDTAAANGETTDLSFRTQADGNHAQSALSEIVTTLVNIPTSAATNYNIGETVHVEFLSSNFYNNGGVNALTITAADGTAPAGFTNPANMVEVEDGGNWIIAYDWDTTGVAAGMYTIEVLDSDNNPMARTFVNLANPATQINFFADAAYTTPTDIFADGAVVYVEVLLPATESAVTTSEINNWDGSTAAQATGSTVTQTGTNFRYNFTADFVTAGLGNGDWGYLTFVGTDNSTLTLQRPIQRNDAGCGACDRTTPSTATIITGNQTINTDPGSVGYTINVTNNDTVACGPTDFDLVAFDTGDTGSFAATTFTLDPLTVSPGTTGSTTMTVTSLAGQPNGQVLTTTYNAVSLPHGTINANNSVNTDINVPDLTAPTVDTFTAPATSTSLTVTGITFTASDNIGVTGWMITESSTQPGSGDAGWLGSAPTSFTVSGDGDITLYPWAKDAAGNVSALFATPPTVSVDATAPTVTSFTTVSTSTSLNVTITQFLASDTIGVTGYMVTENATPPGSGDAGWQGSAPATYTVAADGSYTLYPWAKDALGNVSAVYGAPQAVTVDTTALDVTSTNPTNGAPSAPLDSQVTINFNDNLTCATVNTTNITSDSPGWSLFSCSGSQAIFNTSGQTNNATYNVSVTAAVTDDLGNALNPAPYNFSFTIESAACVTNPPTISIAEANQDIITDNGFVDYTVTINNNDTGGCADTVFALSATENPVTADFTETYPDGTGLTLSPGVSGNLRVRSTATNGILNGLTQTLDVKATGHALGDSNTVSRTTTMNASCNVKPTVTVAPASQNITTDGGSVNYTVTVTNNAPLACNTRTFTLIANDTDSTVNFDPSSFGGTVTVAGGGGSNTQTMTVTSKAGAANLANNNTTVQTQSNTTAQGTVPASNASGAVTTTISRPCVPGTPIFNVAANRNLPIGSSTDYILTVINQDVDCPDTAFDLTIFSEVENPGPLGTSYNSSTLNQPTVTVAAGATDTTTRLTVNSKSSGTENHTLTVTVRLTDPAAVPEHTLQEVVPVTTLKNVNPLLHNSLTTNSTKWGGNWGVSGGKYGEFTCGLCHSTLASEFGSNIKRIRNVLPSAPDTSGGDFPGAGGAIIFTDAISDNTGSPPADPAEFGDDLGGHATSNRICEVCHSQNKYHNYDTANNTGGLTHNNQYDCIACHKHNAGFSGGGSCDTCHGYPPNPGDSYSYQAVEGKGAHVKHVNHIAALAGVTLDPNVDGFGDVNTTAVCGVCHDMTGSNHETGGGTRNINFNGTLTNRFGPSGAPTYSGVQGTGSAVTPKTCSNINCHFQATPWWE